MFQDIEKQLSATKVNQVSASCSCCAWPVLWAPGMLNTFALVADYAILHSKITVRQLSAINISQLTNARCFMLPLGMNIAVGTRDVSAALHGLQTT